MQQLAYDEAGNLIAMFLVGDMNCDGIVDFSDIDALVVALGGQAAYEAAYPDCEHSLGDTDGDGDVDFDDIDAFIALVGQSQFEARRMVYDEENRLLAVRLMGDPSDDSLKLLEIDYDALGRRIASRDYVGVNDPCDDGLTPVETRHIYSGVETVVEYVLCEVGEQTYDWELAREFIWGDWFPEPLVLIDHTELGDKQAAVPEVLHYVHDSLGSVVALLDAGDPNGTPPEPAKMVERYVYDPYGRSYTETWDAQAEQWQRVTSSAYGNPFMWTGQRYDAGTATYHFTYRTYSPTLGRWFQRDPLGYVDGRSLYEYVASAPLSWLDPLGLLKRCKDGKLVKERTGDKGTMTHDGTGTEAEVEVVKLTTDDGHKITTFECGKGQPAEMKTNCHGTTFGDGESWINGDQVDRILKGDKYKKLGQDDKAKKGDVVIYRDKDGTPVHSGKVVEVDQKTGKVTKVRGLGGTETETKDSPPGPGPGTAWEGEGTKRETWRKPGKARSQPSGGFKGGGGGSSRGRGASFGW